MSDEEFPELVELREMQQRRHRQVWIGMLALGAVILAIGLAIFAFSGERPAYGIGAVGVVCIGVGPLLMARAIFSAMTDYDWRPRTDLDPLTLADLDEDEDGEEKPPPEASR